MVFQPTVYLRREYLAGLAAVDMRLTGYFFLWVIDVERVLVRRTTFEVGRFQGFRHFQCHPYARMPSLQPASASGRLRLNTGVPRLGLSSVARDFLHAGCPDLHRHCFEVGLLLSDRARLILFVRHWISAFIRGCNGPHSGTREARHHSLF